MILTFTDDRADLHLWAPQPGAYMRIDTGIPTNPDRQALTRGATGNALQWPGLGGRQVRSEEIPVGQPGAYRMLEPTPEERDAWYLDCCKMAADHFGAQSASQYDIEYVRLRRAA